MHYLPNYLPTYVTVVSVVTVATIMTVVTVVSSKNNQATSLQKKNHATCQKKSGKNHFPSTFRKSNLIHLTTDVIFSGQRFVFLAMFF